MNIRLLTAAAALAATMVPTVAAAEPGTGAEVQSGHAAIIAVLGTEEHAGAEGTLGDALAAGYFGNTSNPRPSGHGVLPSLSPGPSVCVYDSTGTCIGSEPGLTWGELISAAVQGHGQPD